MRTSGVSRFNLENIGLRFQASRKAQTLQEESFETGLNKTMSVWQQ